MNDVILPKLKELEALRIENDLQGLVFQCTDLLKILMHEVAVVLQSHPTYFGLELAIHYSENTFEEIRIVLKNGITQVDDKGFEEYRAYALYLTSPQIIKQELSFRNFDGNYLLNNKEKESYSLRWIDFIWSVLHTLKRDWWPSIESSLLLFRQQCAQERYKKELAKTSNTFIESKHLEYFIESLQNENHRYFWITMIGERNQGQSDVYQACVNHLRKKQTEIRRHKLYWPDADLPKKERWILLRESLYTLLSERKGHPRKSYSVPTKEDIDRLIERKFLQQKYLSIMHTITPDHTSWWKIREEADLLKRYIEDYWIEHLRKPKYQRIFLCFDFQLREETNPWWFFSKGNNAFRSINACIETLNAIHCKHGIQMTLLPCFYSKSDSHIHSQQHHL